MSPARSPVLPAGRASQPAWSVAPAAPPPRCRHPDRVPVAERAIRESRPGWRPDRPCRYPFTKRLAASSLNSARVILGAMSAPDDPPGFFAGFLMAAAFFTRLPVAAERRGAWRLADSAWAFPLVGAGVGLVAASALLLAQLIGLGSWPAALLAV